MLEHLKATEMCTNFIGALHGIAKYYNYPYTQQWLMAGSGMAFLINIHAEICPSAPYVFNYQFLIDLCQNLGLNIQQIGFVHDQMPQMVRNALESQMKDFLNRGVPLIIQNMDNQVIIGYDEIHFLLDPHYPDFEEFFPKTLTMGTWEEFAKEIHAGVFAVNKCDLKSPKVVIQDALKFAQQIITGEYPRADYVDKIYQSGLAGYDQWIKFLEEKPGDFHGHYWNGSVWMECRKGAAVFFKDLPNIDEQHDKELSKKLAKIYSKIADYLDEARDKSYPQHLQLDRIKKARTLEKSAVPLIKDLNTSFNHP